MTSLLLYSASRLRGDAGDQAAAAHLAVGRPSADHDQDDQRKSPRDSDWKGSGRTACEVTGTRRVNVLLGDVKRAISGSYRAIRQSKYDRRKSLFGMRAFT